MSSASSPVAYPPSSSPIPAKRSFSVKASDLRKPKATGFLLDDDSENDVEEPLPKRRMLDTGLSKENEAIVPSNGRIGKPKTTGGILIDEEDEDEVDDPLPWREECRQDHVSSGSYDYQPMREELLEHADQEVERDPPSLPSFLSKISYASTQAIPKVLPSFLTGGYLTASELLTCSGKAVILQQKRKAAPTSFEQLVAARSTTKAGRAKKSYYGIDIHQLIDEASKETKAEAVRKSKLPETVPSVEQMVGKSKRMTLMWTEKYRARNFMELIGDDRTHRQVLRWLKAWDPIVFPKSGKPKAAAPKRPGVEADEERSHRKILLLTGPPGLGKTTLAHVCARQAGYEVMEINASDERSSNVVKGRIRTSVGTESVKIGATVTSHGGHVQKSVHPLCVVVDEVDGVVGGAASSGEGGFIKALIDLILLDQKNCSAAAANTGYSRKKKKGDEFKLMRPLILICNDVYHPSLRPLRQSSFAEIIHVRKPPLDAVVTRMKSVFEKEGVSCDNDAVRTLCEATWGVNTAESRKGKEGSGEGDLRGIMVVGEWAAGKLKSSSKDGTGRLTRKWVEQNMMSDLGHGGGGARGVGRGGFKEVVNRVFLEGAGFPKAANPTSVVGPFDDQPKAQLGVAELAKKAGMERLREMIDTNGDTGRIVTDIFTDYPNQPFNDDSILSKPDAAYEWLHFHDTCSSRVFSNQDFELAPYLSQPILACHNLFASPARHHFGSAYESKKWGDKEEVEEPLPFSGPRADYDAFEVEKSNRATILSLQANINAMLLRSFRSPEEISTGLLPYLVRMLTPEIKPIVVGGSGDQKGIASVRKESEKAMVRKAVGVMGGVGIIFERGKLEGDFGSRDTSWVYRMEPPLDTLVTFETASTSGASAPVRYAVRQVLDQEYQKNIIVRENEARKVRYKARNPDDVDYAFAAKENKDHYAFEKEFASKKDFFGRVIKETGTPLQEIDSNANEGKGRRKNSKGSKVWVSFHEGFSNAVRKPITIDELLRGL
ncbi:hypothetical protein BJ878DRAFT_487904 [Calycina marina]|uniref:AAA+ ATPase domain-containing protein n=1 Tax=Calycina marina TaxID=1763456 RepID=A0A9P7ZAY0_9HELO|nr:hypothetical protein BJ878DRAFT_487904 [Calycina marina]